MVHQTDEMSTGCGILYLKKILFLITCLWVCSHECSAHTGQKRAFLSPLMLLLEIELRVSGRAMWDLNHGAMSPSLSVVFF